MMTSAINEENTMNRYILLPVAALALAALACSSITINLPRLETGPTETLTINEPLPEGDEVVDVTIRMGAGKLHLAGGAEGLAEGEIKYNVEEWEPTVTNTDGHLIIEQGEPDANLGIPDDDVVNDWDLKLGDAPMDLVLNAGAYDGTVDLSGLRLRSLEISDGASNAEVVFDSVNPEEMDRLTYKTGASTVTLTGLSNANFSEMEFSGGAGTYTLDFSGELQRDATVSVKAGASTVRIVVPEGVAAKVTVTGGLNTVDADNGWEQSGDTYEISGEGPTLTFNVEMGVGTLELVSK
jgi:hypothetical protein